MSSLEVLERGNDGNALANAHVDVPPNGKVSELVRTLFSNPNLGSGWIEVQSDVEVLAFLIYGTWWGGIAALPSQELAQRWSHPICNRVQDCTADEKENG